MKKRPQNRVIRIQFTEDVPDEIAKQVREGTLDLGFSPRKEEGADFSDEPLILLERSSILRRQVDEGYREQGLTSKPVLEVKECNVALQYVRLEFGVAVIPEVPAADTSRVVLLPILDNGKEYSRPVYLFWNKKRTLTKTAELFRDFVVSLQ